MSYWIEYYCLRILEQVLTPMSIPARQRFAEIVGIIVYYFFPFRKKVVVENIQCAFPDSYPQWRRSIARKTYVHLAKVYLDLLPIFRMSDERFFRYVHNPYVQILEKGLKEKRGVIILVFHFGNWEIFADWFARSGYQIGAVVKKLKNPLVNEIVFSARLKNAKNGGLIFPKTKSQSLKMLEYIKDRNILYMAADQDARKNGIFVKFFDQWSSTFRGPALFALRQKCPLILGTCLMMPDRRYKITLKELPLSVPKKFSSSPVEYVTQQYTNYFENQIRKHPEQYYWIHRRWKTKPPEELLKNYD